MLFRDFFPRLRDRAWTRYGENITERQFKDWREDGLLPGPAAPKGRGRGKAPERQWPLSSYRRALRICRYKSWGARRQSQWWLGFWLSKDPVEPDVIRASLKREFSIERRSKHSFIESARWRNATFNSVDDAKRGGLPGNTDLALFLAATKMTPDQFRRLSILELDEFANTETEKLIHEIAPMIFNLDAETAAAIKADIAPDEIESLWRPGHMAEDTEKPGKYLDRLADSDFAITRQILEIREGSAILIYGFFWLLGNRSPEQIWVNLLPILASRAQSIESRISQLIRIAFEIDTDVGDGFVPERRLNYLIESREKLTSIIRAIALEKRRNLVE